MWLLKPLAGVLLANLEEGAYRPTDTWHMLDMVSFASAQERDQKRKGDRGPVRMSRLREVLVTVWRFIDGDFKCQQCLVRMMFLLKYLTDSKGTNKSHSVLNSTTSCNEGWISGAQLIPLTYFIRSPKRKALERNHRKSMASFSKTRWWSWLKVMHQIMVRLGDMCAFSCHFWPRL